MKRRGLSPPQCNRVNQCFLLCLDNEKIIPKFEIKDLIPPFKQHLSLERNSPWLICNLDYFVSFRKNNSDFITIIFHTFLPDIFYKLKER